MGFARIPAGSGILANPTTPKIKMDDALVAINCPHRPGKPGRKRGSTRVKLKPQRLRPRHSSCVSTEREGDFVGEATNRELHSSSRYDDKPLSRLPSGSLPSARSRQTKDGLSEFVTHQGEQVWSKLDGRTLTEIAKETGGTYIPAGTRQVNMASVYHRYIANVETTTFETARINRLESRFQWFLLPAVLLLITESLWDFRRSSQ